MPDPGTTILWTARALGLTRLADSVLEPAVSDLRVEMEAARGPDRSRVLARGIWSLGAATLMYAAATPMREIRVNWSRLDAPGPRLLRDALPRILVASVPLLTLLLSDPPTFGRSLGAYGVLLRAPANLVIIAPPAIALGVGLSLIRHRENASASLAVGFGGALLLFAFMDTVVPETNQAYRVAAFRTATGRSDLAPGDREMSLRQLSARIDSDPTTCAQAAASTGCGGARPQRFAIERHRRFSLPLLSFTLVLMAASLARFERRAVLFVGAWLVDGLALSLVRFVEIRPDVSFGAAVAAVWAAPLIPLALAAIASIVAARGQPPRAARA